MWLSFIKITTDVRIKVFKLDISTYPTISFGQILSEVIFYTIIHF